MSNASLCHAIDCDNLKGDPLEPYADISGTGVFWLFVILLWGTVKVLAARNTIRSKSPEVALEEEQWTFGQILPVFLLLGPLFAMVGIFASNMTKTTSNPARRYGAEAYIIGTI
ncbi:hypothetical protein GQ607_009228, partial [Colletotrichum asianum]